MIRMLIADDHPVVRQKIKQLLLEGFPNAYFSETDNTASLVTEALGNEWDIIISDLAMPGGGGIFALEKIKETKPALPIIIVSTYPEDQYAARVISAGAAAFLSKDSSHIYLVNTIKRVLEEVK